LASRKNARIIFLLRNVEQIQTLETRQSV